jgi:hypothetical protein
MIAKVRGTFARWSGTVQVPDGDFSKATVAVTIDASSIATGVEQRDAHLKSPDFFDVAQYPELRFVGKRVQPRSREDIDVWVTSRSRAHAWWGARQPRRAKDPRGNLRGRSARRRRSSQGLRAHWNGSGNRRRDGWRPHGDQPRSGGEASRTQVA